MTDIHLIPHLLDFVEGFLDEAATVFRNPGIRKHATSILLAVEEWYVNIVQHGFNGSQHGHVQITLKYKDGWVIARIIDNGPPFDPHTIASPERPTTVEEAKIGGLGFHLIRNIMDSTDYRRDGERNILIMKKRCD